MNESYHTYLGALSLITSFITYIFYSREILKGRTQPHAFSWLIWTVLGSIAFFGQRSDSAGPGSWSVGFVTIACGLIFFLALKYGETNIAKFDWACLMFAFLAIPLWLLSRTALWSMILISLIDIVGFLPTYRKTWKEPFEETVSLYFMSAVSNLIAIFALDNFSLITGLYPVILVIVNLAFVTMTVLRRSVEQQC